MLKISTKERNLTLNYISQLEKFYSTLDYRPLSTNAIALYQFLLHMAYELEWPDYIKVTNTILTSKLKMTISTLQRARNELIQNKFISYKKRN